MYKKIALLLTIPILLFSCEHDASERISKEILLRTSKFEKEQKAICQKELLEKATHIVDSTLLADALAAGKDTATVDSRLRPEKPEMIETFDSLEVKPIFEDEK